MSNPDCTSPIKPQANSQQSPEATNHTENTTYQNSEVSQISSKETNEKYSECTTPATATSDEHQAGRIKEAARATRREISQNLESKVKRSQTVRHLVGEAAAPQFFSNMVLQSFLKRGDGDCGGTYYHFAAS